MPNWTRNVITVPSETWEKFVEHTITVDKEGQQFDFNKIIPLPKKDLDITSGSGSYLMDTKLNRAFRGDELTFTLDVLNPYLATFYTEDITQDAFYDTVTKDLLNNEPMLKSIIDKLHITHYFKDDMDDLNTLIRGYFNSRRHGVVDWYDAQINLWGTKWNACDTYVDEQHHQIVFNTAWDTPVPIWCKLSENFNFIITFADENDANYGVFEIKDKNITPILEKVNYEENEVRAIAYSGVCHGYDIDEIIEFYADNAEEYYGMSDEEFEKKVTEYFNEAQEKVGQYV